MTTIPSRISQACLGSIIFMAILSLPARAQTSAWQGEITIPTYVWEQDVNPKFWALEPPGTPGVIVYPYTMQDHLSREKVNRTYKALFIENEYLKVTCLPELGGRIHSVLDKTTNEEMFYLNHVIKPSMIAMRGAWISGGIEWNAGPQGHTVTCVTPVNAMFNTERDGTVWLEIGNLERSQRTRWTVRLTLHPGKAYLDEHITLFNPTDAFSAYYFWNCTAFPCRAGTRFIFPMSLGTDHAGVTFFNWPINDGKDLTWLKNYDTSASIFAVDCTHDFIGAYDVDADRGIVQVADHAELVGKKAWTWGTWEYGLVSEQNLTDEDGPYIEVQSGPLPTQSDYGALWPRDTVRWQEFWYPVHGLGDGFEYATRDVAIQTARQDGKLEVRILATSEFANSTVTIAADGRTETQTVELSPLKPALAKLAPAPEGKARISVKDADGATLADFESPLAIPRVEPPATAKAAEESTAAEQTVEELYYAGRKADLALDRRTACEKYEAALEIDPGHVGALRELAVLDVEAGLYGDAKPLLEKAIARDANDGLSWYFLGVCHLRMDELEEALRCGQRASDCPETAALGQDLAGRADVRLKRYSEAQAAFIQSWSWDHFFLAQVATGCKQVEQVYPSPPKETIGIVELAYRALLDDNSWLSLPQRIREFTGDLDSEMIEMGLEFAELGLYDEAVRLLKAVYITDQNQTDAGALPLYLAAWCASRDGDEKTASELLDAAALRHEDFEYPSQPEMIPVLEYAVQAKPLNAQAWLHLGNLYAGLGRLDEAVAHWEKAAALDPSLNVAWRNLGLHAWQIRKDLPKASGLYRKAIAARPTDQTLYRDLAGVLKADNKPDEAIAVLESIPADLRHRADAMLVLAELYNTRERYVDTIGLLESSSRFVNWEGGSRPWELFNKAHVGRGRQRLDQQEYESALQDFDAALSYPENLGVGRSPDHPRGAAHYWRGRVLSALGRTAEAREAWQSGASERAGNEEQNKYRELCQSVLADTPNK